jgi:hypothetical protein
MADRSNGAVYTHTPNEPLMGMNNPDHMAAAIVGAAWQPAQSTEITQRHRGAGAPPHNAERASGWLQSLQDAWTVICAVASKPPPMEKRFIATGARCVRECRHLQ